MAQCKPWVSETFLLVLRNRIDLHMAKDHSDKYPLDPTLDWVSSQIDHSDQPEADQNAQPGGYGHGSGINAGMNGNF